MKKKPLERIPDSLTRALQTKLGDLTEAQYQDMLRELREFLDRQVVIAKGWE